MSNMEFQNDLDKLLAVMPQKVVSFITQENLNDVIEIVLDIGRPPEVRHSGGRIEKLGNDIVCDSDIEYVTTRIQNFTHDNRSGIPGTLHRISAIRNRQGKIVGLTCRIGRAASPVSAHHRMLLRGMGRHLLCADHVDRLHRTRPRLLYQCIVVYRHVGVGTQISGTMALLDGCRHGLYLPLYPERHPL